MTKIFAASKVLPLLLFVLVDHVLSAGQNVGDTVCAEGIAMDYFCIDRGVLFDKPQFISLESPFEHSVMCLVDVPSCTASPYEILLAPKDGATNYTRGYRLDNATKADLLSLAMHVGVCSSCDGNGTVEKGLTVVLQGTVVAAASGDTPPTVAGNLTLADPNAPACSSQATPTSPTSPSTPAAPSPTMAPPAPSAPGTSSSQVIQHSIAAAVSAIVPLLLVATM